MPFSSSAEIQIGTQQPPPATPGFSSAEIHAASRHALLLRRDPGRDAAGAASATPQPSPPPRSTPPQPPAADASPGFSSALGFHRSPRRPSPAAVAGHHDCAARADAATRARDRDPGPPRDLPQRLQGPLRVAAVGAPPPAGDHGGEAEPEPHVGRGDRVPRRRRRRGVRCIRAQRGPLLRHRVPGEGAGAPHRDHGDGRPLARHQVVPAPAQERRQVQEEEVKFA